MRELEQEIEAKTRQLDELQGEQKMLKEEVDEEDIAEIVSKWTGIPVTRLMEGEMQKLVRLEEVLHERVIGQEDAVRAVANAIRRSRAGLSDPNRPIGSFLFLGPTGVGKTELARTLADFLFDDERAMVRIDMSEYQEKHNVSRLVGAPPGYVGYEEGGQLTEAVRRRPYAVVLLDEIEKAHPDVFNVLLQLLDDGRLTDGQGRTVDFTNTVLIMTSNLGGGADERTVLNIVRSHFKPEFLNRVDEIVVFHRLDESHIERIVDIQVEELEARLAERGLGLELTEVARGVAREEHFPGRVEGVGGRAGGVRCDRHLAGHGRVPRLVPSFVTSVDVVAPDDEFVVEEVAVDDLEAHFGVRTHVDARRREARVVYDESQRHHTGTEHARRVSRRA